MRLNEDYNQRIVLNHHDLDWVASPHAGVERRMLDRIGGEVAKATTVVRYKPVSLRQIHAYAIRILTLVYSERWMWLWQPQRLCDRAYDARRLRLDFQPSLDRDG